MSTVLFEINGVLPDGKYLLGQPSLSAPMHLTLAVLTCRPPSSGVLALRLEAGGIPTAIAFTVPASSATEVTQTLALDLSVPANTPLRWKAAFDDVPENAAACVSVTLNLAPLPPAGKPSVNWVNGQERLSPFFTYDPLTHSFAAAAPGLATGRASIATGGGLIISLFNRPVLSVTDAGVQAASLVEGLMVSRESPRLEFFVGSIRVATVAASGLRVSALTEAAPLVLTPDDPAFNSRFEFFGPSGLQAVLSTAGLTGLAFKEPL